MPTPTYQVWICSVCGYVHYGSMPPHECPVCGAEPEMFGPQAEVPPASAVDGKPLGETSSSGASAGAGTPRRVIIAGAGIAGVSAAESLRRSAPSTETWLLSKEPTLPYYRLNLTRYLAGEVKRDALLLHPENWYEEKGIHLRLATEAHSLDLERKQVTTHDGDELPFDKLILAVGSHAFIPPIPGADRKWVTVLRSMAEADALLEAALPGVRCVCVGGGILGLETAGALARRGVDVTVVEGFPWLLPRQLNERAGSLLGSSVRSLGIAVRLEAKTQEIVGDERVSGVRLAGGETLPADLVVITTGVRSNSYLARQAGLQVNAGVVVDNQLQASHPDVYAVGDAAEHRGICYGLWGPAQYQGTIAGMNAAGAQAEFAGIPPSNTLKVLGIDLFSIGRVSPEDGSYLQVEGERAGIYHSFLFRDNRLVGAILLGDTAASAGTKKAIENRVDCSALLHQKPGTGEVLDFLRGLG